MTADTLSRQIRPYQLITFFIGTVIGAGWMIAIGSWINGAGILGAALAFCLGAMGVALIALCYLELALKYPQSGGEIIYAYAAFGTKASFLVGWLLILVMVAWSGFQAVAFGWLATLLVPALNGPVIYTVSGEDITIGRVLIGLTATAILTRMNIGGGGLVARFQEIITLLLATGCLVICLVAVIGGDLTQLASPWRSEDTSWWSGILPLLVTTPIWFAGFSIVIQTFGELTDVMHPRRIAVFIIGSLGAILLFYCVALFAVGIGSTFESRNSMEFAVFAALPDHAGVRAGVIITGLLGITTGWNATLYGGARVLYVLSRSRVISRQFSEVHETYGSPVKAVLLSGLIGSVAIFFGNNALNVIISSSAATLLAIYVIACIAMMRLRFTDPAASRFVAPLFPLLPLLAIGYGLVVLIASLHVQWSARALIVPVEWLVFAAWLLLGAGIWVAAGAQRSSITEAERRVLLLSDQ